MLDSVITIEHLHIPSPPFFHKQEQDFTLLVKGTAMPTKNPASLSLTKSNCVEMLNHGEPGLHFILHGTCAQSGCLFASNGEICASRA